MTEEQRKDALAALNEMYTRVPFDHLLQYFRTIHAALQDPLVPVIEGLEEAIYYTLGLIGTALQETQRNIQLGHLTQADHEHKKADVLLKCVKAAEEYSKLQKGEQNGHD